MSFLLLQDDPDTAKYAAQILTCQFMYVTGVSRQIQLGLIK